MRKNYGYSWWETLHEYAVWPPGSPIELGDYGRVEDGCFNRIGHVGEHLGDVVFDQASAEMATLTISRRGTKTLRTDAELPANTAQVQFHFGHKNGAMFIGSEVESDSIMNLTELAQRLAETPSWERDWLVVTTVRRAKRFSVLVAKDANTGISVRGSAPLVQDFLQGRAVAEAGLEFSGERLLQIVGSGGPVSVQVNRLAWFRGQFKNLEARDGLEGVDLVPFIEPIEAPDLENA